MAKHDAYHSLAIRHAPSGCGDSFGALAEILRADCRRCDYAKRLRIVQLMVVEAVYSASWDAECLSPADLNFIAIDSPGEDALKSVNSLFIVKMAVGRCHEASAAFYGEFECSYAAVGVITCYEEADGEASERNCFVRRIEAGKKLLQIHFVS